MKSFQKFARTTQLINIVARSPGSSEKVKRPRESSATSSNLPAASGIASADARRQKLVIWPEWSDADINAEKWEVAHKGKEKEKGKSPVAQHFFEDPEGKIILPASLPVSHWKRPQEFIADKTPVIVDPDRMHGFDLMNTNDHILQSETIRWIISQIIELWQLMTVKATGNEPAEVPVSPDGNVNQWRPWEHIYAMTKVGKGPNIPQYNPYGKYAVKIFWMGCWRKLVVDDTIPFDDNDQCLLPCTALAHELWPLLLTKALIKVASLDYGGGSGNTEFGDFSVIHCLTGWLPQTILVKKGNEEAIWSVLEGLLPEWKLPEAQEKETQGEGEEKKELPPGSTPEGDKSEGKEAPQTAKEKGKDKKDDKGKDKGKDGGKDKKDKDKDKGKEKAPDEQIVYEKPEVVVFASYHDVNKKNPFSILSLAEMADRSEKLRLQGLSHLFSHPLLLNQVRACPLTPPTPPEAVPSWKMIRPRVNKRLPTSEEQYGEPEVEKPIRCVELQSSFLHYKVSPMPISQDTSRPRSALTRGATRPTTPPHPPLHEADEEAPHPDVEAEAAAAAAAAEAAAAAAAAKEEEERVAREQWEREQREAIALAAAASEAASGGVESKRGKKTSVSSARAKDDAHGGKSTATPTSSAAAGLGPEELGEEEGHEEVEPEVTEPEPEHKMWLDMDVFCECFQAIHVYHKVHTYGYSKSLLDMKVAPVDERQPQYLFVDSLKPSEIFFCMSALCRWNEAPLPPSHSAHGTKSGGKERGDEAASVTDAVPVELPKPQDIQPGSMICERHYWKTILVGDLFKRMRTTGVRAIALRLPEGRHCLKLYVRAPLGYHLQLVSATNFVYGDEEAVLPQLLKDPQRLVAQAGQVMGAFGRFIVAFAEGPGEALAASEAELDFAHCPPNLLSRSGNGHRWSRREHARVWTEALYQTLKKTLPPDCLNADVTFALRVLLLDATTRNPLGLQTQSRPSDSEAAQAWSSREPSGEDLLNIVKLQKGVRGALARKVLRGRDGPEAPEHQRAAEALAKVWTALEANAETVGIQLLKTLFQLGGPPLLSHLPIAHDLRNHIVYADYSGSYAEMPAGHWFVVFREIFHVPPGAGDDPVLILPRLFCPIPSACLRIVDNDSGEELERGLGERNPPHRYRRNRTGYTFVCVARSMETALLSGKWRLRLIGEGGALLQPNRSDLCSSFFVRELHDYYVPRESQVLFRQCVRVSEDHLVTLQLKLSRPDVPVRLALLDNEDELMAISGKGQLVLPAFIFSKDQTEGGEETRTSSRQSQRAAAAAAASAAAGKKRSSGSAKSPSQRQLSRQSSALSGGDTTTVTTKAHKYVIQATVDRSVWPLTAANWAHIQTLKQQEKEELKMFGKNREPSPPKPSAADAKKDAKGGAKAGAKGAAKGGDKGKSGDKGKDAGSRPDSVTFDVTKAHWTMRVVSDNSLAEEFQIRRDTERAEQIRAMKKAWEDVEPGRAERARQSRLRFLNSHLVSVGGITDDETATGAASGEEGTTALAADEASLAPPESLGVHLDVALDDETLTLDPPVPLTAGVGPKEILPPADLTPYLVGDPMKAVFKDYETRVREETEAKKAAVEAHRAFMADWEARMIEDRRQRNRKKVQQIEDAYKIQGWVDSYREEYFRHREAFRQRLLNEEKRRQEELAAAESASQAEAEKPKSPKGKKGSAKGSAKKGKKK